MNTKILSPRMGDMLKVGSICAVYFSVTLPAFAAGPLVIDKQSNVVIHGQTISNPTGDCITVRNGSFNIKIENSTIGPCGGNGINIVSSNTITIQDVSIFGAVGNSINVAKADNVLIRKNMTLGGSSSVYAQDVTQIRVERNHFFNAKGPRPRGNFVQFNRVRGAGNLIKCNIGRNAFDQSVPEDGISLYDSSGTSASPIVISGNKLTGGGPSVSGGGIMLGDGGGSYQVAKNNVLINPGQYGMAIAGGNNQQLLNNTIFSKQLPFTNVGLYAWNQDFTPCFAVTASGNQVNFRNKSGGSNGGWNGGNCGPITGWTTNNFNAATLTEAGTDAMIPSECLIDS